MRIGVGGCDVGDRANFGGRRSCVGAPVGARIYERRPRLVSHGAIALCGARVRARVTPPVEKRSRRGEVGGSKVRVLGGFLGRSRRV